MISTIKGFSGLAVLLLSGVVSATKSSPSSPKRPEVPPRRVVEEGEDADGNPVEFIEEISPGGPAGGGPGPGLFEGPALFQDASPLAALEEMRSLASGAPGATHAAATGPGGFFPSGMGLENAFVQEDAPAPKEQKGSTPGTPPAPWMEEMMKMKAELSRQADEMRAMRLGMRGQREELDAAEREISSLNRRDLKLKAEEKKEEKEFKREVKKEQKELKSALKKTSGGSTNQTVLADGPFQTPWVKTTVNLVERACSLYESEPPGFRLGLVGVLALLCICRSSGSSHTKQRQQQQQQQQQLLMQQRHHDSRNYLHKH